MPKARYSYGGWGGVGWGGLGLVVGSSSNKHAEKIGAGGRGDPLV